MIQSKYNLKVFIEPGSSIVRDAGCLVSSVPDIFTSDGKNVAVVDTTVGHTPEVFEYQFQPDVIGQTDDGNHTYLLAGFSCLAGDVFGEYSFEELLQVGSRVVSPNMGAYTLAKAHTFNGINLPAVYAQTENGEVVLEKEFTYEEYASKNGVDIYASV